MFLTGFVKQPDFLQQNQKVVLFVLFLQQSTLVRKSKNSHLSKSFNSLIDGRMRGKPRICIFKDYWVSKIKM